MSDKKKIKLSDLREIALMAATVPLQKKMGFRYDSKIKFLAEETKAEIEYNIGDDLKELRSKADSIVAEIRGPIVDEYNLLSDEERKEREEEFNARIQSALSINQDLIQLSEKEAVLWKKEVVPTFEPVEIPDKEYAELFGDPQAVTLFDRTFTIDPYHALLTLTTHGAVTIS